MMMCHTQSAIMNFANDCLIDGWVDIKGLRVFYDMTTSYDHFQ